jgi:Flp pilus assembly protein TadD
MTAVKKSRPPANDRRLPANPGGCQKMSYVALPRANTNVKKIAAGAVLCLFIVGVGLIFVVSSQKASDKAIERKASELLAKQAEPYDIVLGASEQAPIEVVQRPNPVRKASHSSVEVTVEREEAGEGAEENKEAQAEDEAATARMLLRRNEITKALQLERHAVELDPSNALYRLELAIMYDRSDDSKSAAELYRNVVQAYDVHDKTLPAKLDIENIRSRLEYLNSMIQAAK